MERVRKVGLTRDIGVMNFDQDLIEKLLQNAEVKPATNQIECHFLLQQKELVRYLRFFIDRILNFLNNFIKY